MFKVGDKVRINSLSGEYEIIAMLGNQRDYAVLSKLDTGTAYPTQIQMHIGALVFFQEQKPKNQFSIKKGQLEAAARFIVANNKYMHYHTVDSMSATIKDYIKDMITKINSGKESYYCATAGFVITIDLEDDNYYVVEVLVDPSVSSDEEFVNVEEII